jgi:hypothetical protein
LDAKTTPQGVTIARDFTATDKALNTKAKLNLLKECLKHAEFFDDKS